MPAHPPQNPAAYETTPYKSQPFSFSHPQHLRMLGILFGIEPADAAGCRVLEIGCGAGQNILPLAELLPSSTFLGVDFSSHALAEAKAWKAELSLSNITFEQADVQDLRLPGESFDYIICHGVFSWIPEEARKRVLELCRSALTTHGIAYISYNTYPGWHAREMLRNMLLYHAGQFEDPQMQLTQARAIAGFYRRALRKIDAPLSVFLQNLLESVRLQPDWYLRHDLLEEINHSFYLHEFVALAAEHGLQYLGDAELQVMLDFDFDEEIRQALSKLSRDPVRLEQYMDFLRNCGFRRSLLCRSQATLSRERFLERIPRFHLATSLRRAQGETFVSPLGGEIDAEGVLLSWALDVLAEQWPESIPFPVVLAEAQKRRAAATGKEPAPEDALELAASIWRLVGAGLFELHTLPSLHTKAVSEWPRTPRFVRLQAARSQEVTNLRHEIITLDPQSAALLPLLDGKTAHGELADRMRTVLEPEQDPLQELARTLENLAKAALLAA